MSRTAPIAWISTDREVMVLARDGRTFSHTLDEPLLWGTWSLGSPESAAFSWPTWSPDGRSLACFRLPGDGTASARLYVHDVGDVSSTEAADLGSRLPIYLSWDPDGSQVAVLSQDDDLLHLTTAPWNPTGDERHLAEGSPLFYTWAGPGRLAAFIGEPEGPGSRLALLDPSGRSPTLDLPGSPSNFCAPLWVGDRVVYVTSRNGHSQVLAADLETDEVRELELLDGLVALVASPDGHRVARAIAPDGDGTPYYRLGVLDLRDGEVREIIDMPCLAYLWAPDGETLLVARVDTDRNLLEWLRVDPDGQGVDHLCSMYPTRDLGFYLRFFEQYTQSHPLIDPTSRHLLVTGTMAHQGRDSTPYVWQVDLETGEAEALAEGLFATYGPTGAPV